MGSSFIWLDSIVIDEKQKKCYDNSYKEKPLYGLRALFAFLQEQTDILFNPSFMWQNKERILKIKRKVSAHGSIF